MRIVASDLLPNKNYAIQVRVDNGIQQSEWSPLFYLTTDADATPPSVPSWDGAGWISEGDTFVASWQEINKSAAENLDFSHYEIEFGANSITSVARTPNLLYTLTYEQNKNLFGSAQGTVTARVRSVDLSGNASAWSTLKSASNPAPGPVDTITVTPLYDSVDVKWTGAVPDDFKSYVLQASTTSASSGFFTVYEGVQSQYTDSTTMFLDDHWYRVYVKDKFGSISSPVISGAVRPKSTFQLDTTAPDVPTGLSASLTNSDDGLGGRALVSWSQAIPAEDDLAGFKLRWREVGGTQWYTADYGDDFRDAVVEVYSAYVNYEFQICSYDKSLNYSPWSSSFTAISPADKVPAAPTGLTVTTTGATFIAEWNAVTTNTDASPAEDIQYYELGVNYSGGTEVIYRGTGRRSEITPDVNKAAFGTPKSTLIFRVRAVDRSGQGTWTSTTSASITAPTPPTSLTSTLGANSINLKWIASTSEVSGYNVYQGTAANPTTLAGNVTGTSWTSIVNNSTPQYFTVKAVDAFGVESAALSGGPYTATNPFLVDVTPPAVPTALAATITNNANGLGARASLTWTNGSETDRAGIEISYKRNADSVWTSVVFGKDATSGIVELQYANTAYDFRVRAFDNSANYSAWSATLAKAAVPAGTPAQVTGLSATSTVYAITYTWTPSTITDLKEYEVTFSTSSTFASGNITYKTGTAASLTNGGLNPNTTYYARVRAINMAGIAGAWSSTLSKATAPQITPSDIGAPTVSEVDQAILDEINNYNTTVVAPISSKVDDSIKSYVTEYAVNSSETVAPTTGWSTATPTRTPGTFVWFRTTVTYNDNNSSITNPALLTGNTGAPGAAGASAAVVYLTANTQVLTSPATGGATTPATATVTGAAVNTTISEWTYSVDGAAFTTTVPAGVSKSGNVVTITGSTMTAKTIAVKMADANGVSDTLTIAKVSNGAKGDDGTPGSDGRGITSTVVEYQVGTSGTTVPGGTWSPTVVATTTGQYLWTRTTTNYTSGSPTISYSVAAHGSAGAQGSPGAAGKGISNTTITYRVTSSGTTIPDSTGWVSTPPATTTGQFLWTKTTINYTDSTTSNAYSVSAHGATGATGNTGAPGADGLDAYTVLLTNEAQVFAATTTAAIAASVDVGVIAYKGSTQMPPTLSAATGMPTGMTVAVSGSGTTSAKYVVSVTTSLTTASGIVNLPITVDGKSFTKTFSWSLSKTGATGSTGGTGPAGKGITSIIPYFAKVTTGTTPADPSGANPAAPWSATEPSWSANTELWRSEKITYTDTSIVYTAKQKVSSYAAAVAAMDSANGVNRVFWSEGVATGTSKDGRNFVEGDTWFQRDATGKVIGQWEYNVSGGWKSRQINHQMIASIDVGNMTVLGQLDAANIKTNQITIGQSQVTNLTSDLNNKASTSSVTTLSNNLDTLEGNYYSGENYSSNPYLDTPSGNVPTGYAATGSGVKTTTPGEFRTGTSAVKYVVAAGANSYLTPSTVDDTLPNADYVTVSIDFKLVSGDLDGSGILVRWNNTASNNYDAIVKFSDFVPADVGKWQRVTKTVKRPSNFTGTFAGIDIYPMAAWSGIGTITAKTIIIDRSDFWPSTSEEISSYEAPTVEEVKAIANKINNFTRSENLTGWMHGEALVDTDFNGTTIKAYKRTSTADSYLGQTEYFDIDPTKAYAVSVWVKKESVATPSANARIYMGLTMEGAEGNSITPVNVDTGVSGAASSNFYFNYPLQSSMVDGQWYNWIGYVFPYAAQPEDMRGLGNGMLNAQFRPGNRRMLLRFLNYYNAGVETTAYLANPSVTEVPLEMVSSAARVNDWSYAGTTEINGGLIRTNTIAAHKIALGDFNNLVADGSLDDPSFSNWVQTPASLTRTAAAGSNPAFISWITNSPPSNAHTYNNYKFEVESGESFYVKFQASTPSSNTANVKIVPAIATENPVGTRLTWAQYAGHTLAPNTGWTDCEGVITIPAGTSARGQFGPFTNSSVAGQEIRVRRMFLYRRGTGKLIVDGSITATEVASDFIKGKTFTIDTGGYLQSKNYNGTAGWRLDESGLNIIDGTIKADTIRAGNLGGPAGTNSVINISSGTSLIMNGGYIKSNTNTGTTIATAEASGAGFFLDANGLFIGGTSRIKANALISDTLTSTTITLGSGGEIKAAGWTINSSGITIPTGAINVASVNIGAAEANGIISTATTIDGGKIKTGSIQSTNYNATTHAGWIINTSGAAEFANLNVWGDTTVGAGAANYIRGGSWTGTASTSGWGLMGDGNAYLQNATVKGTINATGGIIGGATVTATTFTMNSGGVIQTSTSGTTGVKLDSTNGIRAFNGTTTPTFQVYPNGNTTIGGTTTISGTTTLGGSLNLNGGSLSMGTGSITGTFGTLNNAGLTLNAGSVKASTITSMDATFGNAVSGAITTIDGGKINTGSIISTAKAKRYEVTPVFNDKGEQVGLGDPVETTNTSYPAFSINTQGQASFSDLLINGNVVVANPIGMAAGYEGHDVNVTINIKTTSGSNIITVNTGSFGNTDVGGTILGSGIPTNTKVQSISEDGLSATLTANATATATINATIVRRARYVSMVQSYNYEEGVRGWAIRSDGTAEFRDIMIQSLHGDAIQLNTLTAEAIKSGSINADLTVAGKFSTRLREYEVPISTTINSSTISRTDSVAWSPEDEGAHVVSSHLENNTYIVSVNGTSATVSAPAKSTSSSVATKVRQGRQVTISSEQGVVLSNAAGEDIITLPTNATAPATFKGHIIATDMDVVDNFSMGGVANELEAGSILTMSGGVYKAPKPNVSYTYDNYQSYTMDGELNLYPYSPSESIYAVAPKGFTYDHTGQQYWFSHSFYGRTNAQPIWSNSGILDFNVDVSNAMVEPNNDTPDGGMRVVGNNFYFFTANGSGTWRLQTVTRTGMDKSAGPVASDRTSASVWNNGDRQGMAGRPAFDVYGGNTYIAKVDSNGRIVLYRYAGTAINNAATFKTALSPVTSGLASGARIASVNVGNFDYGSLHAVVTVSDGNATDRHNYVFKVNASSFSNTTYHFVVPSYSTSIGTTWVAASNDTAGGHFETYTTDGKFHHYTQLGHMSNQTYLYSYAKYRDTRSNKYGPLSAGTLGYLQRRAKLSLYITKTIPDSGSSGSPNAVSFYTSSDLDLGAIRRLAPEPAVGVKSQTITTLPINTTPAETAMSVGVPSKIMAGSDLEISGEGFILASRFEAVSSTNASTVADNKPGLKVGTMTGTHLRIGTNTIIAMSSNTSQTTLNINPGGLTNTGPLTSSGLISSSGLYVSGNASVTGTLTTNDLNVTGSITGTTNMVNVNVTGAFQNATQFNGQISSTGQIKADNGLFDMSYNNGGTSTAQINNNGRVVRASSSQRFKKYIHPLELSDARKALDLEPVSFQWKADMDMGDRRVPGFIAEQAHEVGMQMWVTYENDDENDAPAGFRYQEMAVAHNMLIKELYEENEQLREENSNLESRLSAIEQHLGLGS